MAAFFTACDPGTATNKPAGNTNAGNANTAAKPAAAAPTKEALLALETKAFEAWKNKDGKFFEGFLADTFVERGQKGEISDRAAAIKGITENKCDIKSISLSDDQMTMAGPDTAILTVKATIDGSCDGHKLTPMMSATVMVRSGSDWKATYHGEAAIVDPKASPPAPAKKDEAAKPAEGAKPAPDAAMDALAAVERKGWEAFKAKDAKVFEEMIAKDFVNIDFMGVRTDRAAAIKSWTTDNQCDAKSVGVTGEKGISLGKDVGILLYKGTAEGKCGDAPMGPLWGTSVYVKEGEVWKAAMRLEQPMQ